MAEKPKKLRELEAELKECESTGDHLEALDIYEEIQAGGWLNAHHLTGMGQCLMKLRRKQDAKKAWIRAFEMDAHHGEVVELLEKHFPGWEREAARMETRSSPKPRPAPPPRRPEPAAQPEAAPPPRPQPPPASQTPSAGGTAPAGRPAPAPAQTSQPAPASQAGGSSVYEQPPVVEKKLTEARINWDYVLRDVEQSRKEARKAAVSKADKEEGMPEFRLQI